MRKGAQHLITEWHPPPRPPKEEEEEEEATANLSLALIPI